MKTVWKFPLEMTTSNLSTGIEITGPGLGIVYTAEIQHGKITLWAYVDTDSEDQSKRVFILGTGHPMPEPVSWKYIDTVFDNKFVWHIFEETKYL